MKIEDFNKALNHIDYDLVDEYVREKETLRQRKSVIRNISRLAPIAACFMIFCVVIAIVFPSYSNNSAPPPAMEDLNSSILGDFDMFLNDDGMFYFKYKGTLYQVYVSPIVDEDEYEMGGAVSILNVGDKLSEVMVIDESGNAASMEIYSSKDEHEEQGGLLLKLNGGYFKASGVRN